MSLLTESCPTLQFAHHSSATTLTTPALTLQPNVKLSSGSHSELVLTGPHLTTTIDGVPYLKLTINNTHYKTPLIGWTPDGDASLTFARHAMLTAVEAVVDSVATAPSQSPLTASRLVYLTAMTLATLWTQVTGSRAGANVSGVKDTWNFDQRFHTTPASAQDACTWVVYGITQQLPALIPAYDPSTLLSQHRARQGWTVAQQEAQFAAVAAAYSWPAYYAAWQSWLTYRQGDGYDTVGAYVATAEDIPNVASPLVVAGTTDPGDSGTWTPLTLANGVTQTYLGFKWSEVASTCLTSAQMEQMVSVADALYPADRTAEVAEVKDLTASLTDAQKLSAELWAGGPQTYTPPGQLIWLWKVFMAAQLGGAINIECTWADVNVHALSLLDLAVGLFEGSRVVWAIKSHYMQSRPIQEIRHMYYGSEVASWNGVVAAEAWVPYQTSSFVSPPFADFCSGHSYFSQTFAQCMTRWFGTAVPPLSVDVSKTQLTRFAPLFAGNAEITAWQYLSFQVAAGSSEIEPGSVPSVGTTLAFGTWAELAQEVGMSRLYGGIHCITAHQASVAVSNALYPLLRAAWGIA